MSSGASNEPVRFLVCSSNFRWIKQALALLLAFYVCASLDIHATSTIERICNAGLVKQVTDPMGHSVRYDYALLLLGYHQDIEALQVTATHDDGSYTRLHLLNDGRPRALRHLDNTLTRWEYYKGGQLKALLRAAGSALEARTSYVYDRRGDLASFDPPGGSTGRVSFSYDRYAFNGSSAPVLQAGKYEGQVTRILYPGGAAEYFGYSDLPCQTGEGGCDASAPLKDTGDLAWHRKRDGSLTVYRRDPMGRVARVFHSAAPASGSVPGWPAFQVDYAYDGFGRLTSEHHSETGLTAYLYEPNAIGRLSAVIPPPPASGPTTATSPRWGRRRTG